MGTIRVRSAIFAVIGFLVIILQGCTNPSVESPTHSAMTQVRPLATVRTIPTLYPSPSAVPTLIPTNTRPPEPTEVPSTPIDFDQIAVDIHYSIPTMALDRRIVGTVASKIEINDQSSGESVVIPNQPGILVELQKVLNDIELEELPDDCIDCVYFEYELPLTNKSGQGWLQDPQLLASLENYTSVHIDPHFPPETILGLRQSATPYQVAHTIALTANDELWRWAAIDPKVNAEPFDLLPDLMGLVPDQQVLDAILQPDFVNCPLGPGIETLYIKTDEIDFHHNINCPELTLASSLAPIYLELNRLSELTLADPGGAEPESDYSLDVLIDYNQLSGTRLTLYNDDLAVIKSGQGITLTAAISSSLVVSATAELIDSSLLSSGAGVLLNGEPGNKLFVRGPLGVYSLGWLDSQSGEIDFIIQYLDLLIARISNWASEREIGQATPEISATPTSEPD